MLFIKGNRGSSVGRIQSALGIEADGIFGPVTYQAVRAFQAANDLQVDGRVGPLTWAKLFDDQQKKHQPPKDFETNFPLEDETGESLCEHYGSPGTENLVRVIPPYPLYYNGKEVSSVRLHKLVAHSFVRVLQAVLEEYGQEEIGRLGLDQYGGSYCDRNIKGGDRKSTHAWGIAVDFCPKHNQWKWDHTKALFAAPDYDRWWELWEAEGWYSLGRHHDYDWMHIQAAYRSK